MNKKLKPCPLCGVGHGEPWHGYEGSSTLYYRVLCNNCGHLSKACFTPEDAVQEWGIKRRFDSINELRDICHLSAVTAGWWNDPETGKPLERFDGEKICLMHSELSEALEGVRRNSMDDHLIDRPMVEVELADTIIRILDYAGRKDLDIGGAIEDKLIYNQNRADHKIAIRSKKGGKKF